MSSIVNKFKIFDIVTDNIKQNIKVFYIPFSDYGICVTSDDKVYALGEMVKMCGYSKKLEDKSYTVITELSGRGVVEFYSGTESPIFNDFMIAKTSKNSLYSWGSNERGQLARGRFHKIYERVKPGKIDLVIENQVIQISCGFAHCLALLGDGAIYCWGSKDDVLFSRSVPFLVNSNLGLNEKIKYIHCYQNQSILLSVENNVFISNDREWGFQLKINMVTNTNRAYMKGQDKYFFIQEDRLICFDWRSYPDKFSEMKVEGLKNMNSIVYHNLFVEYLLMPIEQGVLRLYLDNLTSRKVFDNYETPFDFLLYENQSTYKTIHIINNRIYVKEYELNSDKNSSKNLFLESMKPIYDQELVESELTLSNTNRSAINLRVFNSFPENSESKVEYYHQMGGYSSILYSAIVVLNDNNVYGIGSNQNGVLGLGHNSRVNEYTLIPKLCGQNIVDFFTGGQYILGFECVFARNKDNVIYGWGINHRGQLARGYRSEPDQYLMPEQIAYFKDKNIINICAAYSHYLALSSDGSVYAWSENYYKQENDEELQELVLIPMKIDLDNLVKFISCHTCTCSLVTVSGEAYYWGNFNVPCLAENEGVNKMITDYNSGKMFLVILYQSGKLKLIENNIHIFELDQILDIMALLTENQTDLILQKEDGVYEYDHAKNSVMKTFYSTIYEYLLYDKDMIKDTIQITRDGYLKKSVIKLNEEYQENSNKNILVKEYENIFDSKFANYFIQDQLIGQGAFGKVFRVRNPVNEEFFAIKRIKIHGDYLKIISEIKIMSHLNNKYIVNYINSWTEGKVIDGRLETFIYIQMELCSQNLQDLINTMNKAFNGKFKTIGYFIRSQLFLELIECLNHLHSSTPPIIHRDLKPQNVLVVEGRDGRFLKLCDFGLSKFFDTTENSGGVGTHIFKAPETMNFINDTKSVYNEKCDIYSLGVIAMILFDLKDGVKSIRKKIFMVKYENEYSGTNFGGKIMKLFEIISSMLSKKPEERPKCEELLRAKDDWTVDLTTVGNDEEYVLAMDEPGTVIIENIFKQKFNMLRYGDHDIEEILFGNSDVSDQDIFVKYGEEHSTVILNLINEECIQIDSDGILYDHGRLIEIFNKFKIIRILRNEVRKANPIEASKIDNIEQDINVNRVLMPAFLNCYTTCNTTADGSCFYNAISRILFSTENYANVIRLLTFDTFLRLKDKFQEYCQRIGENYSLILLKICTTDEMVENSKVINFNNWAEDPSIIATHIAIGRPIHIFGGFIDERQFINNHAQKESQSKLRNPFYGKFYQNLSMVTVEELTEQFSNKCLGTTLSQCVNISSKNRPVCLHLADNHFTSMLARFHFDPFIPSQWVPHKDFLDIFFMDDIEIYDIFELGVLADRVRSELNNVAENLDAIENMAQFTKNECDLVITMVKDVFDNLKNDIDNFSSFKQNIL